MNGQNTMKAAVALYLTVSLSIGTSCFAAETRPSALAIIAPVESENDGGAVVADLLTVALSHLNQINLVERDRIADALKELEFSSSVRINEAGSLRIGRLVAADLVLIVNEAEGSRGRTFRIRAIECLTGIRVVDCLVEGRTEAAVRRAVHRLTAAAQRLQQSAPSRQYVAVSSITSVESGTLLLPLASQLSTLLELDMQNISGVTVLERDQLQQLRKEESLTGASVKLRASTSLISGTIRRVNTAEVLVKLEIDALTGSHPAKFDVRVSSQDVSEIRIAIAKAISEYFQTTSSSPRLALRPFDIEDEVVELRLRYNWLWRNDRLAEAARLAETAAALGQNSRDLSAAIQLHSRHAIRLEENRHYASALIAAIRAHQLREPLVAAIARQGHASTLLTAFNPHVTIPRSELTRKVKRLSDELDKLRLRHFDTAIEHMGAPSRFPHLSNRLLWGCYFAESGSQFTERCMPILAKLLSMLEDETIARDIRVNGRVRLIHDLGQVSLNLQVRLAVNARPHRGMARDWDISEVRSFFELLVSNSDPLLQIVGFHGLLRLPGDAGRDSAMSLLRLMMRNSVPRGLPYSSQAIQVVCRFPDRAYERLKGCEELQIISSEVFGSRDNHPNPDIFNRCAAEFARYQFPEMEPDDAFELAEHLTRYLMTDASSGVSRSDRSRLRLQINEQYRKAIARPVNPSIESGDSSPWDNFSIRKILFGPSRQDTMRNSAFFRPLRYVRRVVLDRSERARMKDEQVIVFCSTSRPATMAVFRSSIRGGRTRESAQIKCGKKPLVSTAPDGRLFIATDPGELVILDGDSVRTIDEHEGLPGKHVLDLEWFEDSLFISCEGTLVRFHPGEGRFETLASGFERNSQTPFSNTGRWMMVGLHGDQESNTLWLTVRPSANGSAKDLAGLWTLRLDSDGTSIFEPVGNRASDCTGVLPADDWLIFNRHGQWNRIHRLTRKEQPLHAYMALRNTRTPGTVSLTKRSALVVGDHIIRSDGTIFAPDGESYRRSDVLAATDLISTSEGFLAGRHRQLAPGVVYQLLEFKHSVESGSTSQLQTVNQKSAAGATSPTPDD